jgi:hypothetical protein
MRFWLKIDEIMPDIDALYAEWEKANAEAPKAK